MKASPVKQIAGDRAERLRKRAQRKSERSGETGGYNYSDPKVVKLLDKAKKIENKNFIKSTGAKKGSKRKGSRYGEDARVSASYDRPDTDTSPLNAVTATQDISSDMYYQPRKEMDYSTMVEAAGKLGAKKKASSTTSSSDPAQDHSKKIINEMNQISATNDKNEKWFKDNTKKVWDREHGYVRVDANGNIYNPFGQGEAFSVRTYPIIGNTNKDLKDFDPTKTLSIMDIKDLKDNKEKPTFKGS